MYCWMGHRVKLDNADIAGRLEAFASLLDLAEAGPYTHGHIAARPI